VILGNSNSIQVGERVLTMGSPLGLQGSVTTGVVSSIRDDPFGAGFKMIQTDASINPGNSGGPLVNEKAEVVGIIRYKIDGTENLNFAIPINYLRGMMDGPLTPLTLDELRAKLEKRTDVFLQQEAFPTRWKSLTSGLTKDIRRDGQHMYLETVLPDAVKQAGCFELGELQRVGDAYSGKQTFTCICKYSKRNWGFGGGGRWETRTNSFRHEIQIEMTSVTPARIEGYTVSPDPGGKFDCEKDTYSKPFIRFPFTLIPQ
jgi:hypothetical protein